MCGGSNPEPFESRNEAHMRAGPARDLPDEGWALEAVNRGTGSTESAAAGATTAPAAGHAREHVVVERTEALRRMGRNLASLLSAQAAAVLGISPGPDDVSLFHGVLLSRSV